MNKRLMILFFSAALFSWTRLIAAPGPADHKQKLYVNNLTGDDSYDGHSPKVSGRSGPFKTIQKALNTVGVSGYIDIANTGISYPAGNRLKKGGTAGHPLIIEGNHATINGFEALEQSDWEPVEKDIYRTPFWPMSNYLKLDQDYDSWIGSPNIWRINDRPAKNCNSKEALLQTPGGFWWNKAEKTVWLHLPQGVLLSGLKVSIPSKRGTGFNVSGDAAHIIVRNLRSEFSSNDGFSAHDQVSDLLFKDCIAVNNCGQGFSMHGNTKVIVEGGLAQGNASSGACDVGAAEVLYRSCVFVDNTFEAGVFAAEKTNVSYQECLIINNEPFEQIWQKGQSVMTFKNCVIVGKGKTAAAIQQGTIRMEHCTFHNFNDLAGFNDLTGRMELKNCLTIGLTDLVAVSHQKQFSVENSVMDAKSGAGADQNKSFPGISWVDFPASPEYSIGRVRGAGAKLPQSVWRLYKYALNNK